MIGGTAQVKVIRFVVVVKISQPLKSPKKQRLIQIQLKKYFIKIICHQN